MHTDRGLQTSGRLPRAVADAGDEFTGGARGMQRDAASIARQDVASVDEAFNFHFHTFERAIDITHGGARAAFFAENVPRFERGPDIHAHPALGDRADV